jgi:hypothetical protein
VGVKVEEDLDVAQLPVPYPLDAEVASEEVEDSLSPPPIRRETGWLKRCDDEVHRQREENGLSRWTRAFSLRDAEHTIEVLSLQAPPLRTAP